MTYEVVRLLRNKNTGQTIQQIYTTKTIFHRFSEEDYIEIGILLYYYYIGYTTGISTTSPMDILDVNGYKLNAIEIFTNKAQKYIETNSNTIKLEYFNGTHKDISEINYIEYIDKWKKLELDKLGKYTKNTGQLSDNLLYLSYIKENVVNLSDLFDELSKDFELSENDIFYKNLKGFQNWRNRLINDTVNNFEYSYFNKNFLSFILLHLFILCNNKFKIRNLEYIDGGKTINNLEQMLNSKINHIKNQLKKRKSLKSKRKKSKRKKSKRKSRN
jgi:hypothetical protein